MGVKIQKPGDPGHPGGNRRIYVRVNYRGRRKTRVFNSSKAAETYAETVEYHLKHGEPERIFTEPEPPLPPPPAPTFAEVAERWLAVDAGELKIGTREAYQSIINQHLLPTFGTRPVSGISVADVENWWVRLRETRSSRNHLSAIRGILSGIFRRAVAMEIITRNPVDALPMRQGRMDRTVRHAEWLTEAELSKLLTLAREREPRYYPLLLTLATTGVRFGEALGLQVGDVDATRCRLSVRRAIRKRREGSPKSGKAREVDVPPSTMAVLRDWTETVRAEAAVRGAEACWPFPSAAGTPMDDPIPRRAFRRVLRAAGIRRRIRVHDLRHTYASLAIQRGVPLLVVSRQLGHGSIGVTADVYGHLDPEATRGAAEAWERILGPTLAPHFRNPGATAA